MAKSDGFEMHHAGVPVDTRPRPTKCMMCGKAVFKWSLVVFNIIFVLVGVITLGVGLFVKFNKEGLVQALTNLPEEGQAVNELPVDLPALLESATWVLIIAGAFIFLVGFLGCCGAWKELRLFLLIYAIILSLIFIMEVSAGVITVMFTETVEAELKTYLKQSIEEQYIDGITYQNKSFQLSSDMITMSWDIAQVSMKCCGAVNYTDYKEAENWISTYDFNGKTIEAEVPISCCKVFDPSVFPDKVDQIKFVNIEKCLQEPASSNANLDGCYPALKSYIISYAKIVIGVGVGICLIELVGIVFACCLCRLISKEADYKEI